MSADLDSDTTRRFARTTREAFAHERYWAVSHYVSNKFRHRAERFLRNLARWICGPRP